jgi:hypothetical protein
MEAPSKYETLIIWVFCINYEEYLQGYHPNNNASPPSTTHLGKAAFFINKRLNREYKRLKFIMCIGDKI